MLRVGYWAIAEGKVLLDDPDEKRIWLFGHNQVYADTITPDAEKRDQLWLCSC